MRKRVVQKHHQECEEAQRIQLRVIEAGGRRARRFARRLISAVVVREANRKL